MQTRAKELLQHVIVPTIKRLDMDSIAARMLLLGTAAQESHLGTYLKQVNGPALGMYQMEPDTEYDCKVNFLHYRTNIKDKLLSMTVFNKEGYEVSGQLVWNLAYATAYARLKYYRDSEPLPEPNVPALAVYWKRVYNTPLGAGTEEEFIDNYARFIS